MSEHPQNSLETRMTASLAAVTVITDDLETRVDTTEIDITAIESVLGTLTHRVASAGGTQRGLPGVILTAATAAQQTTASRCYYQPFQVLEPITVTAARVKISTIGTAASKVRVSIYNSDSAHQPTTLVSDLGEIAVDALGVVGLTGLSVSLPVGMYLLRMHTDASATQAKFETFRGILWNGDAAIGDANWQFVFQYYVARAYGVAETPGTAWTNMTTSTSPFIYFVLLGWTP